MAGCENHNVIEEKLKTIVERLDKTESKTDENSAKIQALEQNKASNDEKFERVFQLLGDLKDSIKDIQKAIEVKNERLPAMMYSIGGVVVGSSISGVIVWLLTSK